MLLLCKLKMHESICVHDEFGCGYVFQLTWRITLESSHVET